MSALEVDREQIAHFAAAVFRYAEDGYFISMRAFRHRDDKPMFMPPHKRFPCVRIGEPHLVDRVCAVVNWCSEHCDGIVFCPPLATFVTNQHAREEDLAECFAISVECDQHPAQSRTKIEALLGPATIVVASGGEWLNPVTGGIEPKLHLHWRLAEPTRELRDHALLKQIRLRAAEYLGADNTAAPAVHPLRWPGSWHRKNIERPRLARIVAETDSEIELGDAYEKLVIDFGDDAGKGLEDIKLAEINGPKPVEHWQTLAAGIEQGTTGRINAIISVFGLLLRIGVGRGAASSRRTGPRLQRALLQAPAP